MSEYEREHLHARLAELVGGVAVIQVGAATEAALQEKKAWLEDALHATRAAVAEGVVPGGGLAYIRALPALERLQHAASVVGLLLTTEILIADAPEVPMA